MTDEESAKAQQEAYRCGYSDGWRDAYREIVLKQIPSTPATCPVCGFLPPSQIGIGRACPRAGCPQVARAL